MESRAAVPWGVRLAIVVACITVAASVALLALGQPIELQERLVVFAATCGGSVLLAGGQRDSRWRVATAVAGIASLLTALLYVVLPALPLPR